MPDYKLVISLEAKNDLREIYQYGLRNWGNARSANYLSAIKEQFWHLLEQPLLGNERLECLPNARSLAIQNHILFYRVTAKQVQIIRVLHGRQDPQRHLK